MPTENSRIMKGKLQKSPDKKQQQQQGWSPKMARSKQGNAKHGQLRQFGEGEGAILVAKDLGNTWKCLPSCQANHFCLRAFLQGVEAFAREKLSRIGFNNGENSSICDGLEALSLSSPSTSGDGDGKTDRQAKVLKVSLRLESLQLVDKDVEELCEWVEKVKSIIQVKKLWLFGNKITDKSVVQFLAPAVNMMGLVELHLSHNKISTQGAGAILTSLAEMYSIHSLIPSKSLWLRLEWNRISMNALCLVLEHLHEKHGFLADMPVNDLDCVIKGEDGNYPGYIRSAAKQTSGALSLDPAAGSPSGDCRYGSKAKLRFVLDTCHCRLPWIASQYEEPSESEVMKHARKMWRMACHGIAHHHAEPEAPLLIIPDTSSMLSLLSAPASHCMSSFFNLEYMLNLSQAGLFGPSLNMEDQIFLIIPSTVSLQLDSLKSNPALRPVISKFMGSTLDQIGPSGTNTLHMLGNHEAEGILIESHLDATGSNEISFSSTGQRADHRIVETAMYFQLECLRALSQATDGKFNFSSDLVRQKLPVVLLTADKGQERLALHNGLPCISVSAFNSKKKEILGTVKDGKPITSSRMRIWFRDISTKSLGAFRIRSLQTNFDGSIACLRWLTDLIDHRLDIKNDHSTTQEDDPTKPCLTDDEWETIAKIKLRLMEWSSLVQNSAIDADTVTKHWDSEQTDDKNRTS